MAYDKIVDSTQLDADLTSVANAIRAKSGGSEQLAFPAGFISEIGNISTGTKEISITENGVTTENVAAYANVEVTVDVPNSYAAGDEGKVVSNGELVSQGSDTVTQNGTVDTTLISSLLVNVSAGSVVGTFTPASDLTSVTLPDTIGKSNIIIFPKFDLESGAASDLGFRVHWGCLIVNGNSILQGSTNSGATAFTGTMTLASATGHVSNADTFNSQTGTVAIGPTTGANYGGKFPSGKTYGYVAW